MEGFLLLSEKIFVALYLLIVSGLDVRFNPIPIIRNFLLFLVMISCKIPQIFFLFTRTSLGHLKVIFLLEQKLLTTLEMIIGLII